MHRFCYDRGKHCPHGKWVCCADCSIYNDCNDDAKCPDYIANICPDSVPMAYCAQGKEACMKGRTECCAFCPESEDCKSYCYDLHYDLLSHPTECVNFTETPLQEENA